MKFVLEIETPPGNDTTNSRLDIAWLLDRVARRLRMNNQVDQAQILDTADVVVGHWTLEGEDVTPIWGVPVKDPVGSK